MKRRTFIREASLATLAVSAQGIGSCTSSSASLNILVLGGTQFVGPAIVSAALRSGHTVTLFNRGITNPQLFPDLPLIKGDRTEGKSAYPPLTKQHWDVVIDVWPEQAQLVDEATSSLVQNTDHYVFISSIAVYNDFQEVGLHEASTVVSLNSDPKTWDYSEEKVAAEKIVQHRFAERCTIIRPGPIKGWRDPALDLFYWCLKLNRDESILAPGSGLDPLQFIDVNDVGRFAVMAVENGIMGTFNCVGPQKEQLIWKAFLNSAKKHFESDTELIWAPESFLAENGVVSFSDLPLWAPLSEDRGFMQISNDKMMQTGFEYSPITDTLNDCMKWYASNSNIDLHFGTPATGLGLDRYKEVLLIEKLVG